MGVGLTVIVYKEPPPGQETLPGVVAEAINSTMAGELPEFVKV